MTRSPVILDGLSDPALARELSRRWAAAGLVNAVDIAGQSAAIEGLTEARADQAARIAQAFGLSIRDRVGASFNPDTPLESFRGKITHEYLSRLATALVFGLPALGLHYFGHVLAEGGGNFRGAMLYPYLFEFLLTGWACVAAGWPILYQGALALIHLRLTTDLLTTLVIVASFVPIVFGAPAFHVAVYAVTLTTLSRWALHAHADRIAGRADLMIGHVGRILAVWLLLAVIAALLRNWRWGLAVALLFPPALAHGAISRWTPGSSAALPVFAFAGLLIFAPIDAAIVIEVAAGFSAMMVAVFTTGWRRMRATDGGAA